MAYSKAAIFLLCFRAIRSFFGLSQQQVADAIGLSKVGFSRVESLKHAESVRNTTFESLEHELEKLGVSISIDEEFVVIKIPLEKAVQATIDQGHDPENTPIKTKSAWGKNTVSVRIPPELSDAVRDILAKQSLASDKAEE